MNLTSSVDNKLFMDHARIVFDNYKYIAGSSGDVAIVYCLFPNAGFFKMALVGYQAQVFAILLINAVAVNIEKALKKIIPDSISLVIIPFVTVTIAVFLAFLIIAPIGRAISDGVALGFTGLFKYSNFPGFGIGGAIIAFLYSPLVMTGLHQGLLPIKAVIMAQYGLDYTTPIEICANTAQGVCALTMLLFIKRKKETKKLTSQVLSGGISGIMGITEPAIFGVNLQVKHAFLASCCAAAIGGY
jgi:PTS system sucrose-specific IIC component